HGRHAELGHAGKFLRPRFRPWHTADVGAENDFHFRLQGLLERSSMLRGALTIALAVGRIGRSPVVIIRSQRGAVPRALLPHLANWRVVISQAVLERVAPAIQGTLQADSVVGMAGNSLAPTVSFIHDRFQLFHGESWL